MCWFCFFFFNNEWIVRIPGVIWVFAGMNNCSVSTGRALYLLCWKNDFINWCTFKEAITDSNSLIKKKRKEKKTGQAFWLKIHFEY